MSTFLNPSPVFGPIHSRRLGISLGINLLPEDGKLCTFDCIYCECGFNNDFKQKTKIPTKELVLSKLEEKLAELKAQNVSPDVFTFAGNGEPTSHPNFAEIIDGTIVLRDKYFPNAKISVLSNSTFIHKESVREALMKVDNNILKLDTIDSEYINVVDRPTGSYDVNAIIENMKRFEGHIIIQTMFLKGTWQGKSVANTDEKHVSDWLEAVKNIAPQEVMIYTIDRETPAKNLEKATHEELDAICKRVKDMGIACTASY